MGRQLRGKVVPRILKSIRRLAIAVSRSFLTTLTNCSGTIYSFPAQTSLISKLCTSVHRLRSSPESQQFLLDSAEHFWQDLSEVGTVTNNLERVSYLVYSVLAG